MSTNDFAERHNTALADAQYGRRHGELAPKARAERALARMLLGLTEYHRAHAAMYESPIAQDGVLGEHWETIAHAVRGLLNGELGRLDGGLCDRAISDALRAAGFNPDVQGETIATPE